ncbi:MAG: type I glyceraldehyde-3-phosphate dehydrogenase [Deltaproteobacteria bacterium RIFCSPLOWO2_02_FULL_50_16]|nr:MAG: type I glyceraldehyde-3-phosphate dehydrogenase [Deltaproteobacteria bacterium GWA2_50_8]OGQ26770.1 MAG: type I glyceraldehyde-3-phosphate dehydrogenase [Deltaproteobacteria bacterium RIFCSPHIGHO2_02_FULL_50_15]OGQ57051.1 MAG: type I glyceraldehyde-3-phosphate dehydrogenase [Deltaproteobacteria bacterium RIFCSPLOWO2_02_FULL_50_16]OGQ66889.1 MAG: type I glyceraldehyde-3-phosphate dehydrogenase [Deltaproteobacteria bacterium RIFCSPLOWO2_12_FULL_50_11]
MSIRVGINGFGRIGQGILRAWLKAKGAGSIDIVMINDLVDHASFATFLKYDSVHGVLNEEVTVEDDVLRVGKKGLHLSACPHPAEIPWKKHNVDVVFECTGRFTDGDKAREHMKQGVKKVIISAPAKGNVDGTFVMGVNDHSYDPKKHHVISNASCTTNCLAPVTKVLHENYQIINGFMTTIHSYTNDQRILDSFHSDLRRARAGALSQIPTTTGAARAIGLVIPELKGKFDGFAMRVPTPNVSVVDLVVNIEKSTTKEAVNAAIQSAAEGTLKGILSYTEEPLVSIDFNGRPESSIADLLMTNVIGGKLVKVLSWYDNETGFSNRMLDLAKKIVS